MNLWERHYFLWNIIVPEDKVRPETKKEVQGLYINRVLFVETQITELINQCIHDIHYKTHYFQTLYIIQQLQGDTTCPFVW